MSIVDRADLDLTEDAWLKTSWCRRMCGLRAMPTVREPRHRRLGLDG
jgi:hypothetical protein